MDKKEFEEVLNEYGKEISIKFTDKQIENFYKYMNLLIEWNKKINLTAIIEPKEIILKHFIDSLTILKRVEDKESLIDVGTGAGFPGIPLKIMNEDVKVVLLDSLNKRIKFLNEVIENLGLKNIATVHARVEDFGRNKKYRESFDVATSRAVANLTVLSEYMIPLIKKDGLCICMKGSDIEREIGESKVAVNVLGGKVIDVEKFDLPSSDMGRSIVVIQKIEETPGRYPRKAGVPSKEPIC